MGNIKVILTKTRKDLPEAARKEWILTKERPYRIGSEDSDINLSFDKTAVREKGLLYYNDRRWWMKKGTTNTGNGKNSHEGKAIKIGDTLELGKGTQLTVTQAHKKVIYWKGFCIIIDMDGNLNYALLYNGVSFITELKIYNCRSRSSAETELEIGLGPYFKKKYTVPALKQGEYYSIDEFDFCKNFFDNNPDASRVLFRMCLNKCFLFQKEINIFGLNSWLKIESPYTCTSLASFILPDHTYITKIANKIKELCKIAKDSLPAKILYDYFKSKWDIHYISEPISADCSHQKIRLPHHILYDWENRKGEGNCLDLSLLFASCLEALDLNPLIYIVEIDKTLWHAFIGLTDSPHFQPLIRKKEKLNGDIKMIDPLCITSGHTCSEAAGEAEKLFKRSRLLFALDITSAREYGIRSLPFRGVPKESPLVIGLDVKARELTTGLNADYKVCTTLHMLVTLINHGNGFTRKALKEAGINSGTAAKMITGGLRNIKIHKKVETVTPSANYKLLFPRASLIAKEQNSLFVMEEHILLALLEIRSSSLDAALEDLGCNKYELRNIALNLLESPENSDPEEFKSFYNNRQRNFFFF